MKNFFLLTILLFQLTFTFGQTNWGSWTQIPCYKGISFRVKQDSYNDAAKKWSNSIEIRNSYNIKVSFNYDIKDASTDGRVSISAGGINKGGWFLSNASIPIVEVTKVCFDPNDYCSINSNGIQNKGYKCYAECDNGIPNTPSLCGNVSSSSTTSPNQQTQLQNDLAEYNRSKADLERQMAEKNADIQRQNQENTRLGQIWNNAIKAGVDAHNSGNYTEAKNQFTIAVNNSSNETNRQNAQNYYNKSVDAEKSQGKIKAYGELATITINAVDEYSKANREIKKQKELAKNESIDNLMKDDIIYNTFIDDIINTFTNAGFIPSKIGKLSKETSTTTSTVTKTQSLYFEKFELFIMVSTYENKSANFGAIRVISNYREEWEKIRDTKLLNKWEKEGPKKNKFQNAVYKSSNSADGIIIGFDNKVFKNYSKIDLNNKLSGLENSLLSIKKEIQKENTTTTKDTSQKNIESELDLTSEQLFLKGKEYYSKDNFLNAYQFYEKSSIKGYSEAMTQIGRLYADGKGVSRNYTQAMNWYLEAVKKNNTNAMVFIAYLYEDGDGVTQNIDKAMEWLLKASALGDASAMYEIGGLYDDGELIPQNHKKAVEWYEKSAKIGNTNAMYNLAAKYQKGEGVNIDIKIAKEWFKNACQRGKKNACERLKELE